VRHLDRGLQGDPKFRNIPARATNVLNYNPKIGADISSVRLIHLNGAQKHHLALLISTRGVVFFWNQDDFDIEAQRELGKRFGALHKHTITSVLQKA
jgi:sulfonate dioxygenase